MFSRFSWRLVLKFIKMTVEDKKKGWLKGKKLNMILLFDFTFLVEFHLDDVLEFLLLVRVEFSFLQNLYLKEDSLWWLIYKWWRHFKKFLKKLETRILPPRQGSRMQRTVSRSRLAAAVRGLGVPSHCPGSHHKPPSPPTFFHPRISVPPSLTCVNNWANICRFFCYF